MLLYTSWSRTPKRECQKHIFTIAPKTRAPIIWKISPTWNCLFLSQVWNCLFPSKIYYSPNNSWIDSWLNSNLNYLSLNHQLYDSSSTWLETQPCLTWLINEPWVGTLTCWSLLVNEHKSSFQDCEQQSLNLIYYSWQQKLSFFFSI